MKERKFQTSLCSRPPKVTCLIQITFITLYLTLCYTKKQNRSGERTENTLLNKHALSSVTCCPAFFLFNKQQEVLKGAHGLHLRVREGQAPARGVMETVPGQRRLVQDNKTDLATILGLVTSTAHPLFKVWLAAIYHYRTYSRRIGRGPSDALRLKLRFQVQIEMRKSLSNRHRTRTSCLHAA